MAQQQRHKGIVFVLLTLVGLVAVYAARGTQEGPKSSAVVSNEQKPLPAVVDRNAQNMAADGSQPMTRPHLALRS